MRILLLGDYSNVHATLANSLRQQGHDVTLASDGDGWKNYSRDIDLRRPGRGRLSDIAWLIKLWWNFRKFRDYDVVQLINPIFLPLRAERLWPYYQYLRRHNAKVFLGAFGMDRYYVSACTENHIFRYSDFNLGPDERHYHENAIWIRDWLHGEKGVLNERIARDVNAIAAGLYEYYAAYRLAFAEKTQFIPFPINTDTQVNAPYEANRPVRFFIGIQQKRSQYKGTDIMLSALERLAHDYPQHVEIICARSLPFDEYIRQLSKADVLLDQLYSYTPAMNALEAMAHGIVVVGGGEEENYEVLHCSDIRPIVNVKPTEEDVYQALLHLLETRAELPRLQRESRLYIERYHDSKKIAQAYLDFWQSH